MLYAELFYYVLYIGTHTHINYQNKNQTNYCYRCTKINKLNQGEKLKSLCARDLKVGEATTCTTDHTRRVTMGYKFYVIRFKNRIGLRSCPIFYFWIKIYLIFYHFINKYLYRDPLPPYIHVIAKKISFLINLGIETCMHGVVGYIGVRCIFSSHTAVK